MGEGDGDDTEGCGSTLSFLASLLELLKKHLGGDSGGGMGL